MDASKRRPDCRIKPLVVDVKMSNIAGLRNCNLQVTQRSVDMQMREVNMSIDDFAKQLEARGITIQVVKPL